MKESNLVVINQKRRKYRSYQGELTPAPDNLLQRDFTADKPNEKWLTDITEFTIPAGKVYLSPILDCFEGLIVSWSLSTHPDSKLTDSSLKKAIDTLSPGERPIVHNDRGSHYRSNSWIHLMHQFGLTRSMSKKGCTPDNAACEGFFGRLKNECFYGLSFENMTTKRFMTYIDEYIHWHNTKRIKASLGFLSPQDYRNRLCLQKIV